MCLHGGSHLFSQVIRLSFVVTGLDLNGHLSYAAHGGHSRSDGGKCCTLHKVHANVDLNIPDHCFSVMGAYYMYFHKFQ